MSSGNLDFEQFRVFLEKACGILLGSNKQYLVSSRLNKLMEQHAIKSLGELVQRMQSQPRSGLREQVVDAMTTNETLWFRDTYPFEVLKNRVLPEMIKASPGQRLRIWSAACSSGQEPYSLSMSIDEFEKTNIGQLKAGVQIVGTDLSPSELEGEDRVEPELSGHRACQRGGDTPRRDRPDAELASVPARRDEVGRLGIEEDVVSTFDDASPHLPHVGAKTSRLTIEVRDVERERSHHVSRAGEDEGVISGAPARARDRTKTNAPNKGTSGIR